VKDNDSEVYCENDGAPWAIEAPPNRFGAAKGAGSARPALEGDKNKGDQVYPIALRTDAKPFNDAVENTYTMGEAPTPEAKAGMSGEHRMSDVGRPPGDNTPDTGTIVKARPRTKRPSMYKVLMLNDDYTPMEFVVDVLVRFFAKPQDEAIRIMLHVHQRGVGVCGVFTYEIAETKVNQVMDLARQHQHPLQCTIEKDGDGDGDGEGEG